MSFLQQKILLICQGETDTKRQLEFELNLDDRDVVAGSLRGSTTNAGKEYPYQIINLKMSSNS